jgi:hypothetical protein
MSSADEFRPLGYDAAKPGGTSVKIGVGIDPKKAAERLDERLVKVFASMRKLRCHTWIEESNQRFYASNHFGQHPERLVPWFNRHMGGAAQSQRSSRKTLGQPVIAD